MQVIDRRGKKLTVTFGDLAIGDAFQDEDGDINIKVDVGSSIYWSETSNFWAPSRAHSDDELIIPLEVTYTFEREEGRK